MKIKDIFTTEEINRIQKWGILWCIDDNEREEL